MGFWDTNRSPDLGLTTRPRDNQKKKKKKKKKKRTCRIGNFAVPADYKVNLKENEKRDEYIEPSRELKKSIEHEDVSDTNCDGCIWNNPKRIAKSPGRLGNRTCGDYTDYSIINIGQNTEKCPGDLRRLTVNKTVVKTHPLTLV